MYMKSTLIRLVYWFPNYVVHIHTYVYRTDEKSTAPTVFTYMWPCIPYISIIMFRVHIGWKAQGYMVLELQHLAAYFTHKVC